MQKTAPPETLGRRGAGNGVILCPELVRLGWYSVAGLRTRGPACDVPERGIKTSLFRSRWCKRTGPECFRCSDRCRRSEFNFWEINFRFERMVHVVREEVERGDGNDLQHLFLAQL